MQYYGQHGEDSYIEKYFDSDYVGTCIDIGAAHPVSGNNTYLFETKGWNVICVEPNPAQVSKLLDHRKNVFHAAAGAIDEDSVDFSIVTLADAGGNQEAVSALKLDADLLQDHQKYNPIIETIKVNVRTVNSLLEYMGIEKVDFISIDTEGTELDVLKGFDILKYQPKLFIIENNYNKPDLENYLKGFGYKKDNRVVVNDFYVKESLV